MTSEVVFRRRLPSRQASSQKAWRFNTRLTIAWDGRLQNRMSMTPLYSDVAQTFLFALSKSNPIQRLSRALEVSHDGETMARCSSTSAFSGDDFPTFGGAGRCDVVPPWT